jgi:copper(I)-binding protein
MGTARRGCRLPLSRRPLAAPAGVAAAVLAASGCAAVASVPARPIQVTNAYVLNPVSGSAPAYLLIDNPGAADRLVGARSGAGGQVTLMGPPTGTAGAIEPVRGIRIPANALVRLTPASFHLLITGARLRVGTEVMLTLVFSRSGPLRVGAVVTNPQSGGGSYLGQ